MSVITPGSAGVNGGRFTTGLPLLVLVFFINPILYPIEASEVDPGCIEFKPGDQPIHNTLLRGQYFFNF